MVVAAAAHAMGLNICRQLRPRAAGNLFLELLAREGLQLWKWGGWVGAGWGDARKESLEAVKHKRGTGVWREGVEGYEQLAGAMCSDWV